jgi:glycosyltransferase involved in cell wall biosynthesis
MFDYSLTPGRALTNRYGKVNDKPLVSIITPFYNAGEYFEQTFNSVINQTFPYFEWIIVNDGSTIESDVDLLKKISSQDSRIIVIHKENGGATEARNIGVEKSSTEYIAFLDADDLYDQRYLEQAYFALEMNPGATWVYSDSLGFGQQTYLWEKEFSSEAMKRENILPYAAVIRKSIFFTDKYYNNESKNLWEDYQLWLKLLADGHYPVHIKQIFFWYRRHDNGWLSKIDKDINLRNKLEQIINQLVQKVPDGIRAITFAGKKSEEFKKPYTWEWKKELPFKKEKTRILMLIPHMEMGGADKFNLDIVTHIDKERFEIGIITTVSDKNEWRQNFSEQVQDIFELPAFLDMNDWSAFIHYYIKSRAVDIVMNISSYFGYYTLPWLRKEFPRVAIIDCVHAEGRYWRAGGYPRVSAAVDCVIDKTFVTNEYTRNIMAEKYGKNPGKMQVIYTGVDETYFNPETVDSGGIREQFGIAEGRPIVLFLCRIAPEKRPFLMLEIANEVKKRIKTVCFLVVGDGPQREELQKKVELYNLSSTVIFAGKQEDIRPFYKVCQVFLLSSIKEGLSITTMEAMLMGKPVISADVGSQYELVMNETGRLIKCRQDEALDFDSHVFPQDEINDYVNAVCDLIKNEANLKNMGQACREKIIRRFTLKQMIDTLEYDFTILMSSKAKQNYELINNALQQFKTIADDYLALYITYESKDLEAAEVWNARERYRMLYEQACNNNQIIETLPCILSPAAMEHVGTHAEQQLQEIYNMRSWKLIQKYRHFMDEVFIGKLLKKILKMVHII